MKNFVAVKTFNTHLEANIAKSLLDANNVASFVSADDEGGTYPFPLQPSSNGVQIFVNQNDFAKASKLLDGE